MDDNAYTRDIPSSMAYSISFDIKAYSRNNDQIQPLFIQSVFSDLVGWRFRDVPFIHW
jgi:hypothetical protein